MLRSGTGDDADLVVTAPSLMFVEALDLLFETLADEKVPLHQVGAGTWTLAITKRA